MVAGLSANYIVMSKSAASQSMMHGANLFPQSCPSLAHSGPPLPALSCKMRLS